VPVAAATREFRTSGLVRLNRTQLVGTMTGLLLGMLLAALDQTIVGTAEPRIIASLSGFDRYPWVATIYLLCSTISIPIGARLSDLYGRKVFFLGGATLFVAASALCGAAGRLNFTRLDGMNQLIVFRGLQGIGAGLIMALVFTILADIFAPVERGRYQGFFSGVWGVASIFGPTLGGYLTDTISWRATFYVNLPVGLVALAAIYFGFPDFRPQRTGKKLDWAGLVGLIAVVVPLLLALSWVTQYGWSDGWVQALLAWSAAAIPAFIYIETRAAEPLIPLTLFRDPIIRICSVSAFVLGMGMFGVIVYLPLFMQGVLGVSATQSGTLLTPMMLGTVVGTFLGGQMTYRLKEYKTPGVVGAVLAAAGMAVFAQMDAATPRSLVVAGMIAVGLGIGLLIPVHVVAVQNTAPRHQMGAATASTTFFRTIGGTVGIAVFGSILLGSYHDELARRIPAGTPPEGLEFFSNPLLLAQVRPQLDTVFGRYDGGPEVLQTLLASVPAALSRGLHLVFLTAAIVMMAQVFMSLGLKRVPLRSHHEVEAPEAGAPAH
jgi:EmrB/QacA subfamily drug resistance transporter